MIFYKIIFTHVFFFSRYAIIAEKVKNIKEQEGERTLIAVRSWLRTMTDGENTQKWLEERQQGTLIAAAAAAMDEDDDDGQNTLIGSQRYRENIALKRYRVTCLHTSVRSIQGGMEDTPDMMLDWNLTLPAAKAELRSIAVLIRNGGHDEGGAARGCGCSPATNGCCSSCAAVSRLAGFFCRQQLMNPLNSCEAVGGGSGGSE